MRTSVHQSFRFLLLSIYNYSIYAYFFYILCAYYYHNLSSYVTVQIVIMYIFIREGGDLVLVVYVNTDS